MASRSTRPRPARRHQRLTFPAIEIVGGLLTPEIVTRLAEPDGGAGTRKGYGIPEGLDLRDEIARAFRIAEAQWSRFEAAREGQPFAARGFVDPLLREVFGFKDLSPVPTVTKGAGDGARIFPIGHAAGDGRVPVVVAPVVDTGRHRTGLDVPHATLGDGGRVRSATQLLQEYLNVEDDALWGLATDGRTLRLLRDNLSLTRPAWIEVDLDQIFRDGLYADFSALWLLIHRSRFGFAPALPSDCPLERWREQGRQQGVAARDKLRVGVETALLAIGQGAIAHPANTALRDALTSGELTPQGFYEELLGGVYRLIFLFAAEDRDLLHPPDASDAARRAYAGGYGVGRLRERAVHRTAWNRHHDAWDSLRVVFRVLPRGTELLGLPGLGGLFDPGRTPYLDACRIDNRHLMEAIFRLAWIRPPDQSLARVNWRDMETEELGSVYEGLLELVPEVDVANRRFAFQDIDGVSGSARKSTGSYYTPDALVRLVLDKTLDPLLERAEAQPDPEAAILKLTVLDPACGSGHFLLGAARRMAQRLAALRSPGAPGRDDFQHALRDVVSRCLYGVDRNPLAVELCKVALWIEALEPGRPLSYLDARILCGDSLIGVFDLAVLAKGVPDAAYSALTGDDATAARQWRRWNKEEREGAGATGIFAALRPPTEMIEAARAVADMPEDTVEGVERKARAFEDLVEGENWRRRQYACDLFVAAFFARKAPFDDLPGATPEQRQQHALGHPTVPTTGHVWAAARGEPVYPPLIAEADRLAHELRAFHWPIAFPAEMARGGFDAVIGNPPWEVSQLQEQEFFASRDPAIAQLAGDRRKSAIKKLPQTNPILWRAYQEALRGFECANQFYRGCGRFPRVTHGKLNTYALFAEHGANLIGRSGRAGVLVPTGIATDSSTAAFFGHLIDAKRLATLIDFENRRGIFSAVHRSYKFSVLALGPADVAEFAFFLLAPNELEDERRRFTLSPEQIARINPNTKTAPIFRSRADAELTAKIYDRVPVLVREEDEDAGRPEENPWGLTFQQGLFNMTSASELFWNAGQLVKNGWQRDGTDWVSPDEERRLVPLYEAKMIHHFDHRWATYDNGNGGDDGARDVTLAEKRDPAFEPTLRYWVPEAEVRLRSARVSSALKSAVRAENPAKILKALADHVGAAWPTVHERPARADDLRRVLGAAQPWTEALDTTLERWLARPATSKGWAELQRKTPLDDDDLHALADAPPDVLAKADRLIGRKRPRWLMGWRDICRSTDERTVITTVFPLVAAGHKLPLFHGREPASLMACCLAMWISMPFDYCARQKIGATSLTYMYLKQFPCLSPACFSRKDVEYIRRHVLELSYTSHAMGPWAEDLGYQGPPFGWDPVRRAQLRAELDGFFARKYGLTRDELRYVLDPADVHGPDYPSETFRGLRDKEMAELGEYRTRRLVLEAYDSLEWVR